MQGCWWGDRHESRISSITDALLWLSKGQSRVVKIPVIIIWHEANVIRLLEASGILMLTAPLFLTETDHLLSCVRCDQVGIIERQAKVEELTYWNKIWRCVCACYFSFHLPTIASNAVTSDEQSALNPPDVIWVIWPQHPTWPSCVSDRLVAINRAQL